MDSSELDQLISLLENEVSGVDPLHAHWKPIWDSIRVIGSSFKGTRYPTRAEKDQAWQRFQGLVERVKAAQAHGQQQRSEIADASERWRNKIRAVAYAATPPSGWEESIYALTFGLVENVIRGAVNALLPGPETDETKVMLLRCSEKLREGWDLLSEYKTEMLGRHKKEAFDALTDAQTKLDVAWGRWKEAKERTWEAHREQKREKRETFEHRVHANIEKLEERMERLSGVLRHKESHLDDLQEKRSSARSDEFRDRVDGWIEEEVDAIRDIRSKIEEIEGWIEEERSKLR